MMRIGSIRPEYEFDDEDSIDLACFHLHEADVFVQWILAFFWIFKAFVQVNTVFVAEGSVARTLFLSSQPQPETIVEVIFH
ncbi:unnamed protein product [Brassica oleracea]